jgi:hypothetical protein
MSVDQVDEVPVASQDEYEQETQNEQWVVLEDAHMKMKVREPPLYKLLIKMKKYGLLDTAEEVQDDVDLEGIDSPEDLDDVDDEELQGAVEDFDMEDVDNVMEMMNQVIAPYVVQPQGFWDEKPSGFPEGVEGFDISTLTENDISVIMDAIIGSGADMEQFQG